MKKRITSLLLAAIMLLQIIIPQNIFAEEDKNLPQDKYVKVGMIDAKSYDAKIMNELNRIASRNRTSRSRGPGVRLFSRGPYFGDNNEPKDKDKPKYFGNVSAKLDLKGLDGNAFQWNEIFGVDENGNPKPAQIIFRQMDEESSTDTGLYYMLQITKEGKYTWSDGAGNPTKLPLFSKGFKPYRYEVRIDERVSDKVKLLTEVIFGTEGSSPTFSPENSDGEIIANITLGLTYQQIASTKFKSEWHTGVAESNRPGMKANFAFDDGGDGASPVSVELPKNDKDTKIVRDWENSFESDLVISNYLEKTPDVKIDKTTNGLTFKEAEGVKTVKSGDHKFKYEFTYGVINGGKLTMTEVIPVTFNANGGKFENFTAPDTEKQIVKEVDYDGTLTDKAETPKKPGKAFKGWATDANGTTPATEADYKNLKAAKTFYAIWSDEDIQADELKVAESFGNFPKKGNPSFTNDFVPTFEDLKAKVKVKNPNGDFGPLPTTGVTFSIVDGTKEYTENSNDLKKFIYEKVKENNKDEVSRTEKVKAKITYDDGTTREIEIPIKVLKNIYKGSDQGNKLPHIPTDYVKVTIDPTDKAQNPDKTYYYVNPKAKVEVPKTKDPVGTGDNKFSKWTIKADGDTVETDYTFGKRQVYDKEHTITAQYGNGIVKIAYVDQDGNKIDEKYQIAGQDYPSEKSGGLGREANDNDFAPKGPKFKGYVYDSRDDIKGKHYKKDQTDPNNLDTVTYKYYKKVTTTKPKYEDSYFKVIFDANGGEFKTDPKNQKTVYVLYNGNDATVEKVIFDEVREAIEEASGKPTKDKVEFKEWQDKASEGTRVADNYEIKSPNWDWQKYPEKGYAPETFYAHYEQASAFVKYLDLDGKPIVDEFKINTEKYPTEKEGKAGQDIDKNVYTAETAPKFTGYKFNRIELNPANGKYALDKKATIKIYYEKVPDVIPAKDGTEKPDGYVTVNFLADDAKEHAGDKARGLLQGTTKYYVNPKAEKKNSDLTEPTVAPKTGFAVNDSKWNPEFDNETVIKEDKTYTAQYKQSKDIIPSKDPKTKVENTKPDGYVTVTFVKGEHGKELTGETVYYVNPDADPVKTLANDSIVKPEVKAETGWKQKADANAWNFADTKEIRSDITVIAQYEPIADVVPKDKPQGGENDKPDGYITVTFKTTDKAGNIEKVVYVNPNKAVELTSYAPEVKPITGYEFADWDRPIKEKIQYKEKDVITAKFNEQGAVIPKKNPDGTENKQPTGYKTVTFVIDPSTGGKIADKEVTVYYVNPDKKVTVPQPKTQAETGFEFDKWDKDTVTTAEKYTKDTTVKGNFKKLDDIIPQKNTDGSDKPEGYHTVTFKSDANGSLIGKTVYYVNSKKTVDLTDTAKAITKNPNTGYTAEGGTWSPAITSKTYTENAEYTFNFVKLDNVIPEIKEGGNKNVKPEGYVTVTLIPTDKATDPTNKVFFVKPNVEVKIPSTDPVGKENEAKEKFIFKSWDATRGTITPSWKKPETGNTEIKGTFIQDTEITAQYSTNVVPEKLVPAPVAKKNVVTPKGDTPKPEDLIKNKTGLPNGTTFKYTDDGTPDLNNPGKPTAKVEVKYPNGKTVVVEVPITVVDNVVPQIGNDKPLVPETYVKVTVDTTDAATDNTKFVKVFWVKPNEKVKIPDILDPTGKKVVEDGVTKTNNFKKWKLEGSNPEKFYETEIEDTFAAKESTIVATYEQDKNVEPKGKNNQWIPQGSNPSPKDFIKNPYNDDDPNNKDNLPPGTKIEFVKGKEPDTKTPGTDKGTTIKITYPNGETKEVPVKYNVTGDVVEQKEGEDKPNVPDNYVKVILIPTDKATDGKNKVYFVNPKAKNVTITNKPEGKKEKVNNIDQTYTFEGWKVTKGTIASWANENINGQFTQDTEITAQYSTKLDAEKLVPAPVAKKDVVTAKGDKPKPEDLIKNIPGSEKDPLPKGTEITYEKEPNVDNPGDSTAKVKIKYPNGKTVVVEVPITVVDNVVPQIGNDKPLVPESYVKVLVDTTDKAEENTRFVKTFWVKPNVEVTIPGILAPTGKTETINGVKKKNKFVKWQLEGTPTKTYDKEIKDKFTANVSKIIATYEFGKDETTPDQPGGQPGEVEKHGHRYIERVAGKDRVHTAINTSRRFFEKSRYVIIADSGNYPDALTATVLAHVLDAPILLNNTRYLEDDVAREIVRLGASEVIIVGGHKSISENVKSQLSRYDQNSVQRIWGRDRYVTSSELAYEIQRLTGKVNKAIIASGENFPDALATAPLGSKEIAPILLVRRNQIDKKVDKALKDLNIKRVYVAGGPNSVSKKLEEQLPQVIRRFNGRDRYETAILVASYTYPESKEVFVASGEVFPDALVIGPVCARRKAPILLSRTTPVKVTDDYIEKSNIEYLYIIGGTNTIYAETAHKYAIED